MPSFIDTQAIARALIQAVADSDGHLWIMAARLSFPAERAPASELAHPVSVHMIAAAYGREREQVVPTFADMLDEQGNLPEAMRLVVASGEDPDRGHERRLDLSVRVEVGDPAASGESVTARLRLASGRALITGPPQRVSTVGRFDSRFMELSTEVRASDEGFLARALAGPGECAGCALRALHIALASPLPEPSPWVLGAAVDPEQETLEEYASRVDLGGHAYGALFMRTPSAPAVGTFLERLAET